MSEEERSFLWMTGQWPLPRHNIQIPDRVVQDPAVNLEREKVGWVHIFLAKYFIYVGRLYERDARSCRQKVVSWTTVLEIGFLST